MEGVSTACSGNSQLKYTTHTYLLADLIANLILGSSKAGKVIFQLFLQKIQGYLRRRGYFDLEKSEVSGSVLHVGGVSPTYKKIKMEEYIYNIYIHVYMCI